jgi:hypothetical protein
MPRPASRAPAYDFTWYPHHHQGRHIGFGGKVVLELDALPVQQNLHLFQVGKNASLFGNAPGHSAADRPTLNSVIRSVRRNKLLLWQPRRKELPDWALGGGKLGEAVSWEWTLPSTRVSYHGWTTPSAK